MRGVDSFVDLIARIGIGLAAKGVAIGFIVLGWLLFSENSSDKKSKKQ